MCCFKMGFKVIKLKLKYFIKIALKTNFIYN